MSSAFIKQKQDITNEHISVLNNLLKDCNNEDIIDIVFIIFWNNFEHIPFLYDLLETNYVNYKYEINIKY